MKLIFYFILIIPSSLSACSVCFGDPESPMVQGMNNAILFLLCVTALVLSLVGCLIYTIRKRTIRIESEEN